MKKLLFVFAVAAFTACGGEAKHEGSDTTTTVVTSDTTKTVVTDTNKMAAPSDTSKMAPAADTSKMSH